MNYKKTILENGVRVITVPMDGNPTVTVMVTVGTGSYNEEAPEAGLSHFLEHMCFKGTSKRASAIAISTELDSIGATYNAFTSNEITGYYAKADARHFEGIGDIIADIYKNSVFPEGEIEKEKGVVLGEIDMYADEPQEKISDALREFMYEGQVAARPVLGSKETVRAITRADLIRYRDMQYRPHNTLVTIAGGVTEGAALAFARAAFGDMPAGQSRPEFATKDKAQTAPETVFLDKDTDQAHMILAWRTFGRSHADRFAARIANGILRGGMSSRLFVKLRDEMGSGYYIGSGHETHNTFGQFHITTGTTAERVPEIASAIIAETRRLQNEPVPSGELEKIRSLIRSRIRMSLETSDGVADFFADQEMFEDAVRSPEELDAILSAVSADDVMRVSKELFDPRRLTCAVIGKGIDKTAVSKALAA